MAMVTLDMRGSIIKVPVKTLMVIPYFENMFKETEHVPDKIEVSRSPILFHSILDMIDDPYKKIDCFIARECDFYGINYDKYFTVIDNGKCQEDDCTKMAVIGDYCSSHTCSVSDCMEYNYGKKYCWLHRCQYKNCRSKTIPESVYCSFHHNDKID